MSRVVVGMSGGVDSSVAAFLLKEEGYDVHGLTFALWEARSRKDSRTCCSLDAIDEAAETAGILGIDHRTVDVRDSFIEKVIDPFVAEYLRGSTPNPCILCNLHIKFPYLLREAERTGADFIATGHYACTVKDNSGFFLRKGLDASKDQTYFLYVMNQEMLQRSLFPLCRHNKVEVREIAEKLKIPAAHRAESVDICFIEGGDYTCFIGKLIPEAAKPGPIAGPDGRIIGTHDGIYHYTVGQRKGLGVAYDEPLYVKAIDLQKNTIHTAVRGDLFVTEVDLRSLHLNLPREVTASMIEGAGEPGIRVTARIRSTMESEEAMLCFSDEMRAARLVFDDPQWPSAPGQGAVFYQDDILIGGGTVHDQR